MPVHFSEEEMRARRERASSALAERGLDALLMFKQESMYYLSGYDTFGFSMFQCLVMDAGGRTALLTRMPDLRQARYTSDLEDIRIWHETEGANPVDDLRALLREFGLEKGRLGIELDSYGLKALAWERLKRGLDGFCVLEDASTLVDRIRSVKSPREIEYARRAAELADDAWDEAVRLGRPGAFEGDILAAMQGAVFKGGGDYAGNEFIIGSGPAALLVRYHSGRRHLGPQDQLTLEFAGAYRRYHAAMMRTLLTGRAHPRHVDMHRAVSGGAARVHGHPAGGRDDGGGVRCPRPYPGPGRLRVLPLPCLRLRHGRGVQPAVGRPADVLRRQSAGGPGRQRLLPAHGGGGFGRGSGDDPGAERARDRAGLRVSEPLEPGSGGELRRAGAAKRRLPLQSGGQSPDPSTSASSSSKPKRLMSVIRIG